MLDCNAATVTAGNEANDGRPLNGAASTDRRVFHGQFARHGRSGSARHWLLVLVVLWAAWPEPALARNYFVAPNGSDDGPGTLEAPFRTIQKAADVVRPGDTCYVRAGVYRETVELRQSGRRDAPIRFTAYPGERVVLDGTEPVRGPWTHYRDGIYKTHTKRRFEQLFVDGQMMLEARWPNTSFDKLLTREGWASAGPGSTYQKLRDPELAKTGIDWTGATAVLNVAHQFWTWSRPVLNHRRGSDTFEYRIKMNPFHSQRRGWWDDDYYYLMGKLEALDRPTEWFLSDDGTLYLWPPAGDDPSQHDVRVKVRDYGFRGNGLSYVQISGFHFFACTFTLTDAEHCLVENCHLLFPSFVRGVPDADEPPRPSAGTRVSGQHNTVRNCSLAYCANFGIEVRGRRNVVENCLIHDVNWSGTLRYPAIALIGSKDDPRPANVARRNTVYNVGNAIITSSANRYGVIEYNHVHHGGLISCDVSLIYTSLPYAMGTEIRYNWVHNSLSPNNSLGIRGDDKTRGLRIHHNVVWNIRRDGIVVKGGQNRVYNNTCFANGAADILFFSGPEVDKWWQKWAGRYEHQNEDSLLINNCAKVIVSTRKRHDPGLPGDHSNNYTGSVPKLVDPEHLDFRPRADSPLVDAGRVVEGVTAPFQGAAPDIGAYEFGAEPWWPGHHNSVCVTRGPDGTLRVALGMPILKPVTLSVRADETPLGTLTFTPADWFHPQPLPTGPSAPAGRLRFRCREWGEAVVTDVGRVTGLREARALFERPDLSSATDVAPRFYYEEVYQPASRRESQVRAFRTSRPVVVDGRLDKKEWPGRCAERVLPLTSVRVGLDKPPVAVGSAYFLFDDQRLYVAFEVSPPASGTQTRWGRRSATQQQASQPEAVELAFRPVVRKRPGPVYVLRGDRSGQLESTTDGGATEQQARQLQLAVQYAAQRTPTGWTAEFAIPWKALGGSLDQVQSLAVNVAARCPAVSGGPWFCYATADGSRFDVDRIAVLQLRPVVRADAVNLLTSGSFESEKLAPWRLSSNARQPLPKGSARRVREGRDGSWCVRMQATDPQVMKQRVLKWVQPLKPGAVPPGTYCLSYDVRVSRLTPRGPMGSFNAYLRAAPPNDPRAGKNVGQSDSRFEGPNLPWTRRELILTVPEGMKASMVSLQLHQATGTVWIDNVSLLPCE